MPHTTKEVSINVRMPQSGFPKLMYFNRFKIEKDDIFATIYFGFASKSAVLIDQLVIVMPLDALKHQQSNLLQYREKALARSSTVRQPEWQPVPSINMGSQLGDLINMSSGGKMAETSFCALSTHAAIEKSRSGSSVPLRAQPVALLRSSFDLQLSLIEELYA